MWSQGSWHVEEEEEDGGSVWEELDLVSLAVKVEGGTTSQELWEKSKKQFSPSASRKEHNPTDTLILAQGDPF